MAIKMENAAWGLYRHDGANWIFEDANANDQEVYANENGAGWTEGHELYRWISVGLDGVHVWERILTTDKYAPSLPPQSVTISNVNGGLGTNHVDVGWAEATNHFQYDLIIEYYNTTDPTKDTWINLTYPRNGVVTYRFTDAGADSDEVYARLWYQSQAPVFVGPSVDTSWNTIT